MGNILFLTDSAKEQMVNMLEEHNKHAVRLALKGGGCAGFKYDWSLEDETKTDDEVIELFIKNASKYGISIFRIFDALNDINNIKPSIQFVNKEGQNSQGTICYTTSPVHNLKYWIKLAKKIEDPFN